MQLEKKSKVIRNKIDKAMDLLIEGSINSSLISEKINTLNEELNICLNKINELNNVNMDWINKEKIRAFLIHSKDTLENTEDDMIKQKIVNTFLDKIVISNDNIEVLFKIKITTSKTESGNIGGGEA